MASLLFDILLLSALTSSSLSKPYSSGYSYYPDYGDDYNYYDQSSPIFSIMTVLINNSFTVNCLGIEDMTNQLQLVHNGQEMEGYSVEEDMSSVESMYSFKVKKAALSDSGKWSCVGAGSGQGAHYHVAVLPAVDLVSLVIDGVLIGNQSVMTLREGSYIQPVCARIQTQGYHIPSSAGASWSLGDEPVNQTSEQLISIDTEGREHITYTMHSFRVDRGHFGKVLICNIYGESVGVELQVEHQPEFTISREPGFGSPVLAQMTVSLRCEVEASPESHPYWEKNGVLVSNTSQLLFTNLSIHDEGWYQCSTNHKLGNFSSVGYFLSVKQVVTPNPAMDNIKTQTTGQVVFLESGESPINCNTSRPVIIPPTDSVSTNVGQSVILSIQFCSNPKPTGIFWVGPQVLLKPGEQTERFYALPVPALQEDMCVTVSLELEQVELKDKGEYLLLVRNKYGIQEGVVWLEMNGGEGEKTSSTGRIYCDIIIAFLLLLHRAL